MLERVPQPGTYSLPMSRLCIDDIKEIYKILDERSSIIRFEIGQFIINTFVDFEDDDLKRQEKVDSLIIKTAGPNTIDVNINSQKAEIVLTDSNNLEQLGLKDLITKVVERRKSFFSIVQWKSSTWMVAYLISGMAWAILGQSGFQNPLLALLAIVFFSIFVFSLAEIYVMKNRHTEIYLIDSNKRISFFKRNKDPLLTGIITGIIGTVAGVIIGFLL